MRIAVAALLIVVAAQAAHADEVAGAKELFDQGKTLFAEGSYGKACEKLQASYQLSKLSSTSGLLGACYEKIGKLASAWAAYRDSAAISIRQGNPERAQAAQDKADELRPKLAELSVDTSAVRSIKGLEVAIDGITQPAGALDVALPIDGAPHLLTADAVGWKKWETTIDIADGEKQKTAVPMLVADPKELAAKNVSVPWSGRKKVGFAVAVGGGAAVGFAAALGIIAKTKWEGSNCVGTVCPSKGAQDKADSAATYANVATVVGAVGLAGIGVGLTIFFTGRKETAQLTPVVKPGGVALVLEGRF